MKQGEWLFTDFQAVLPSTHVNHDGRPGTWQLAPYRASDFSGVMILANPDAEAPKIEIDIPLQGRYDLFLGLYKNYCDRVLVGLNDTRCFERLAYAYPFGDGPCFQEAHWRTVELSGEDTLHIKQDGENRAGIGYILARPASPQAEPERQYLLHVTDDGFPSNWGFPLNREDASWLAEPVSRLGAHYISRGCDMAGMANYATRHTELQYDCERALQLTSGKPAHRTAMEILHKFQREGYSVPRRYYEIARNCGMEPLGYSRMAHTRAAPPYTDRFSSLYDKHPEWRCIDLGGDPVSRLSIAFPEVCKAFFDLFTEQMEMGATGINNVFVRGLPMVLYEQPVRDRFEELHGEDMTRLPEDDPRAQDVRAEFMTAFMRQQRDLMDRALGRRVTIMVTVPATEAVCHFYGLDIKTWIEEGFVDILCPYRFGFESQDHMALDLDFFCRTVAGTGVRLMPHVRTWRDDVKAMLANARAYAEWPIDGFSVWDGAGRSINPVYRLAMNGLASRSGISTAIRAVQQGPKHRPIITVGTDGALLNKYPWGWNN